MFSHFGEIILKKYDKSDGKRTPRKGDKFNAGLPETQKGIQQLEIGSANENMLAATSSKSPSVADDNVTMMSKIKTEITAIHETVSTVQSLIPLIKEGKDGQNLIKKLYDTNIRLQSLLPMMNVFMNQMPPEDQSEMEVWKLERENMSREFETIMKNFQIVQEAVMEAVKNMTSKNY